MGLGKIIKETVRGTDSNTVDSGLDMKGDRNYKLPAGTGPGTTGKPATSFEDQGMSHKSRHITDRASANPSTLKSSDAAPRNITYDNKARPYVGSGFHPTANPKELRASRHAEQATGDIGASKSPRRNGINHDPEALGESKRSTGNDSDFSAPHSASAGHNVTTAKNKMSFGDNITEDQHHLQNVVHEKIRHVETEEVLRQKEHDRHVHHIQHHVQPVMHREERDEQHHHKVHPTMHVHEHHASQDGDVRILDGIVKRHQDTVHHAPTERTVINKGEIVNENVHHHVHHIIQPVIEQETIDRHRIHTVIPTHQVTHEAPVIHKTHVLEPVSMDKFMKDSKQGNRQREVDGIEDKLTRDLKLADNLGSFPPRHEDIGNHSRNDAAGDINDDGVNSLRSSTAESSHLEH